MKTKNSKRKCSTYSSTEFIFSAEGDHYRKQQLVKIQRTVD